MPQPCGFEHGAWRKAALFFSCATCRTPQAVFFVRNRHALLEVRLVVWSSGAG